jgi:hypothetical protein
MDCREGQTFVNWSQSVVVNPYRRCGPRTVQEVVDIIRHASAAGREVRACGSGWSFSDIMVTTDYLVDTNRLRGVARLSQGRHSWTRGVLAATPGTATPPAQFGNTRILPDGLRDAVIGTNRRFAWVGAGTTIKELYTMLGSPSGETGSPGAPARAGWALPTMGGASGQTLAGAISTGTHGGDFDQPPIADMVRAIHMVAPDGQLLWIEGAGDRAITDRTKMLAGLVGVPPGNLRYDDTWFDAVLVSLGAMGVICSYVIELVDQYGLSEHVHETTWARIKPHLESGEIFTTTTFDAGQRPWIDSHPATAGRRPQGLGIFINTYRLSYDPRSPAYHDRRVMLVTHARSPRPDPEHQRPAGPCDLIQALNQSALIGEFEHTDDPAQLREIIDRLLDSLRDPAGTAGYPVAYSVLDTTSSTDRPPVLSIEIAVTTAGNQHVRFVDHLFRIFDDTMDELRLRHGAARFAGGFNLRFTRPTSALLGMQHPTSTSASERFCHIEIIVMREQWRTGRPGPGAGGHDYTKNEMENYTEVWTDRFERATSGFGARLHWGQLSRTGQHDPHRYRDYDQWLAVRNALTRNGAIRTFDNAFTRRHLTAPAPSIAHAAWLHGSRVQVEFPDRIELQRRMGFYTQIRGRAGSDNWFHFAIPTPVIVDDVRLLAGSVILRLKAANGAMVHAVHVYDGERRIASHDGLSIRPGGWTSERFAVPGTPEVRWGLGISVGARFATAGGELHFASAGCDFARPR